MASRPTGGIKMNKIITFFVALFCMTIPASAELNIQEVTSKGGIKAWLVSEPSIPMIAMNIGFQGASTSDPSDKLGATYMMAGLLEEGAGDMDATAFKQASEELASSFSFDSSRERITIKAKFLSETRADSIALLKTAITNPAFNDVAFARIKSQIQGIIAGNQTDPDKIASRKFSELAFANHVYARPHRGTAETVATLTVDDIRAAHKRTMTKDHLFVGVVGDITADDLAIMLDDLFGELPAKGAPLPEAITFQASGGTTVVDFDTPQSVALWGHQGIAQTDPDFFPAFVMNRVLGGGGFTSRLTTEVREKRGLTYGVYSYLAGLDQADYFGGSVASGNDRIGEAIEIIKLEWERMAQGGVTDAELDAAIKYMTGSYPLRFDGNAQIAGLLTYSQMNDFPIDYPKNRNSYIEAVTKQDIARVAKRIMRTDDMRFVVVGKPVGVTSTD
jgi:zinc protease